MDIIKNQIKEWLSYDEKESKRLFALAREKRKQVFKNNIFAYGFVYFSTFCRNSCNFCYYRKENQIDRYRKDNAEILKIAKELVDSGVNLIDLTMGEDPVYHKEYFSSLITLADKIKKDLDVPVMLSPGVVEEGIIDEFAKIDADWYALYQETHNRKLFERLRKNQSYDVRMQAKLYAKTKNILIEEGILTGVGETDEDIADSIIAMGEIGAKQLRVMSFVPQDGSPMEAFETPDRSKELKIIAIMRILYPEALIPASLDVDGISGLKARLNAGANVVTSIIPPKSGFVGVANETLDVDEGGRTVEEVKSIVNSLGLEIADNDYYKAFIHSLKAKDV